MPVCFFDLDSDVVKPAGRQIIDRTAKQLVARKVSGKIEVTGYTDSSGSASHNLDLSRRRAASVAKVLGSQLSKGVTLLRRVRGRLIQWRVMIRRLGAV
ncbi:outer membrane protein A [Cutibacterium acnes JCM 18909]|nr:outer membrane protein A [Cutibacterium acnes JCM 18909]